MESLITNETVNFIKCATTKMDNLGRWSAFVVGQLGRLYCIWNALITDLIVLLQGGIIVYLIDDMQCKVSCQFPFLSFKLQKNSFA